MSTVNKVIEAVAQGTQQAQAALGQTLESLQASAASATSQAAQVQGRLQAQTKANLEQATRTAEALIAFGQGNLEAVTKSGQIWIAGVQDLSRQSATYAQAQINETIATARALAGVKSVKEACEVQATAGRTAVERTVAETSRVAEASVKLAEQAAAPVLARIPAAVAFFTPAR